MPSIDSSKRISQSQSTPSGYPPIELHEEKIFITVKTYPRPSKKYRELVCTVGITESGKWIRLYPVDYRYQDFYKQYHKNQWISVKIEKNSSDARIDSYKPVVNSLKLISSPFDSKNDKKWEKRKGIIMPTVTYDSLEQIEDDYHNSKISLGIFKPKKILEFIVEKDTEEWNPSHQNVLNQMRLFEAQPKKLNKIPFKFSYKFLCNDERCIKPHKIAIIDWEIFALYLSIKNNYPYDMDEILQKIEYKWLTQMWSEKRDSYLIVGNHFRFPTFMVLGVFWPPKDKI